MPLDSASFRLTASVSVVRAVSCNPPGLCLSWDTGGPLANGCSSTVPAVTLHHRRTRSCVRRQALSMGKARRSKMVFGLRSRMA